MSVTTIEHPNIDERHRVQPALEHRAERFTGIELGRYVRDVYTYAHFPLVAGIVLTAVALETVTLVSVASSTTAAA